MLFQGSQISFPSSEDATHCLRNVKMLVVTCERHDLLSGSDGTIKLPNQPLLQSLIPGLDSLYVQQKFRYSLARRECLRVDLYLRLLLSWIDPGMPDQCSFAICKYISYTCQQAAFGIDSQKADTVTAARLVCNAT